MELKMTTKYRSDDCASGLHDYCGRCQCDCHGIELTLEQAKALYRVTQHEYISYEEPLAHEALNLIYKAIKDELGSESS